MEERKIVGQIKTVQSKSLVSLDKSYRIIIETDNCSLMEAGTWPADESVKVSIERIPKGS